MMADKSIKILILLGSNIEKEKNLPRAVQRLQSYTTLHIQAVSSTYESAALNAAQEKDNTLPTFHNAALLAKTSLEPLAIRTLLRQIERELGRVRTADKFAPRPIDLDLVCYGQAILTAEEAGSEIPDPDILSCAHVAIPLAEIAPDWVHPQTGQLMQEIAEGMTG